MPSDRLLGALLAFFALSFGCSSNPTDDASDGGPSDAGAPSDAMVDESDAAPDPECDPEEEPGEGIFVSHDAGDDSTGDGSALLPLATIASGTDAAIASGMNTIYLDQGTYREAVHIPDTESGLFLEGGWAATGASWSRDCDAAAAARTIVAAPQDASVAVTVEGIGQASGLRRLTVATKAQGATIDGVPGESLIGVFVREGEALFALTDVEITAGHAGDGGMVEQPDPMPPAAPPGSPDATCDGINDCSTGADGTMQEPGLPTGETGTFDHLGYVPANGMPGVSGQEGQNGTASTGTPESKYCITGCGCRRIDCCTVECGSTAAATLQSAPGTCGCGGEGGAPGLPGLGGGASVALLVTGSHATVEVTRGSLSAGDGGAGSPGSPGGLGGDGSSGQEGEPRNCYEGCSQKVGGSCESDCHPIGTDTIDGLPPGGDGGDGADGSAGGAGSGGPSYAVVTVAGAEVELDDATTVTFGAPGAGPQGAADGTAGELLVVP